MKAFPTKEEAIAYAKGVGDTFSLVKNVFDNSEGKLKSNIITEIEDRLAEMIPIKWEDEIPQ